jgi:xanthine dehydrogenase YagR molybdenum-binding subunit
MIYRSRWPAAHVTSVNIDKAKSIPGIKAAVVEREGERTVRFYGEELAAVAGVSKQACLDALRVIEVKATPLPFVVKEDTAKNPDAPRVWPDAANLADPNVKEKGDVDEAFADAAAVVEGFFTTPVQVHHPLETHGNTVSATNDGVTCWASTQGIFSVRDGLASYLDVSQEKVRVITDYMGGGFGAKFGPGAEGGLAARLSQAAGAPVKLMLTRFDQSLAVGNRPSSFQHIRLGATADGKLVAFDMDAYGTAGIGAGAASAGGGGGSGFPAPYIYAVPNIRVKQSAVAINAGEARAFRAPGHPIASFGMESIMDELAVKLKMDPVEFRLKNDPSKIRQHEYEIGAGRFGWKQKYKAPGSSSGPIKVGVGCAGATWGGGGRGSQADAQINPDGSVEVRCGTQDLGTGTGTLVAVVAAEVFGLKPERITVKIGDTQFPPSGASGGSTTAASVCPAIFDACTNALQKLQQTAGVADARGANWAGACKKLGVNPLTAHGEWREGLSSSGVGGVQFAEVEVDTETGFVRVRKILCVQDCGLVVDRLTCETQIQGGIIMGLGYALYEERVMDSTTGVVLNPNFETYKLPNFADVPEIQVILMDMPERGVIGVGEPCTIPTASAIANAVANALGVRVTSLPITPARVLTALGKALKPGASV